MRSGPSNISPCFLDDLDELLPSQLLDPGRSLVVGHGPEQAVAAGSQAALRSPRQGRVGHIVPAHLCDIVPAPPASPAPTILLLFLLPLLLLLLILLLLLRT